MYVINLVILGTPALTSRGFVEEDFVKVAEFFDASVKLALKIKADSKGILKSLNLTQMLLSLAPLPFAIYIAFAFLRTTVHNESGTKLKDFVATMKDDTYKSEISSIRHEVEEYAKQFPTIGFEKETMKYKH